MPESKKTIIIQYVMRALRPLITLLIHQGIGYREFSDACKTSFFLCGKDILKKNKTSETGSQLSLLTGLHRKDVTAFLNSPPDLATHRPAQNSGHAGAAVIARWISSPDYLTPDDTPRALEYSGLHSFSSLVQDVSKDIRPKTYLDELLRLQLISLDTAGRIHLEKEAFIPSHDLEEKLKFFARNIGDHLSATTANIQGSASPFFDRSAFHGDLTKQDINTLHLYVEQNGMHFLKELYHLMETLSKNNKNQSAETPHRVTVGLYMFEEERQNENEK